MKLLSLFTTSYQPLNTIKISQKTLLANYTYLSSLNPNQQIAPVLKSNAYGHGIVQVATALDKVTSPFFCVDSIYEGYQLLKASIKTPILIMGYVSSENLRVKKLPFSYAVYSEDQLMAISKYQPHAKIHIFVDTGMHREGILLKDLAAFVIKAKKYRMHIEGLMSHLAMADKPKQKDTQIQIKEFQQAVELIHGMNVHPKYIHLPASLGILHNKEYSSLSTVGRAGIALYGIDPEGKDTSFKPVLSLETTIIQIKELLPGEKVGYDFTFTAKKPLRIALLPIGYNDGVDRGLSNKGYVQVGKDYCPIIGRVSMNITAIDITNITRAQVGDRVTIYSSQKKDKNSISSVAKITNRLPYEILIHLHPSTRRVIV